MATLACPRCRVAVQPGVEWCPTCGFQQLVPTAVTPGPVTPVVSRATATNPVPVAGPSAWWANQENLGKGAVAGVLLLVAAVAFGPNLFGGEEPAATAQQASVELPRTLGSQGPDVEADSVEATSESQAPGGPSSRPTERSGTKPAPATSDAPVEASASPTVQATPSAPAPSAAPSPTKTPDKAKTNKPKPNKSKNNKPKNDKPKPATPSPTPVTPTSPPPTPEVQPVPTPAPTAPDPTDEIRALELGLTCPELKSQGISYPGAVAYWVLHGKPWYLDLDHNGRPCEVVYPADVVKAYWGS